MSPLKFLFGVPAALLLFAAGCATSDVSVTSGVSKLTRREVARRPVELPGGYDVDQFHRLRMMVADGAIESNAGALKQQRAFMNTRFQSEMAKHRRFDFNAVHGLGAANRALNAMVDQGTVAVPGAPEEGAEDDAKYGQMPDLLLGWNINIQEQREARGSHAQAFKWLCTVNATVKWTHDVKGADGRVKYRKNDVAMTRDFDLPVIVREQRLNSLGGVRSGFNYGSDADVQGLMQEIVIAATERIAEDLGRQFPVGGRIVGALGTDLMTLDQGADQGVEKAMEMVVFARCDDVDVPLANAVASPAKEKSQLEVWRFSDSRQAKRILRQIGDNPKRWMKETGNRLYGVRAVPPQNDRKGTRFEHP